MPEISRTETVTAASPQFQQFPIGKKHVFIKSSRANTDKVYIALSYNEGGSPETQYDVLPLFGKRFYSAPEKKLIMAVCAYTPTSGQKIVIIATDGSYLQNDLDSINFDYNQWALDGSYSERWEQGFRKFLYHGRTGAYFASESLANVPFEEWTLPPILAGVNSLQSAPWNNAINMRNAKPSSPTVIDEVYFGLPKAHFRMVMRVDALMPTTGHLGANDVVFFGFETNSAGGACAAGLYGYNGQYQLQIVMIDPITLGAVNAGLVVTLPHTGVFCEYHLVWDYPYLTLLQYWSGARTILGTLVALGGQPMKMIPMITNESETNVITDFQVGTVQVWEIEPKTRGASATAAANTQVQTVIQTESHHKQLDLWLHSAAGNLNAGSGSFTVEVSLDGSAWVTVDTVALIAGADQAKHYGENHLSGTTNLLVNPTVFPFIRVTLPALTGSIIGTIRWALR